MTLYGKNGPIFSCILGTGSQDKRWWYLTFQLIKSSLCAKFKWINCQRKGGGNKWIMKVKLGHFLPVLLGILHGKRHGSVS